MLYHSTRSESNPIDSAQAVLEGLAPDGGLYMPQAIPAFDWKACLAGSSQDMATAILKILVWIVVVLKFFHELLVCLDEEWFYHFLLHQLHLQCRSILLYWH